MRPVWPVRARPSAVIGIRPPWGVAGQRALACGPPVLPVAAPGRACLQRITRRSREDIEGLIQALPRSATLVQASIREPPAASISPIGVDRALQFAREVEASGGKSRTASGVADVQAVLSLKVSLCLHGGVLRHGEQPDPWHRGCGNLAGCVERAPHGSSMFDWPEHSHTSPTSTSRAVCRRVPSFTSSV